VYSPLHPVNSICLLKSCGWEAVSNDDHWKIKVNGKWADLYRAVDSKGRTIDFYLSPRRNSKAAYRFLGKILNNVKGWQVPHLINTDKAPTYGRALALLKREGRCPPDVEHRQIKSHTFFIRNSFNI
jgi:IS6 family transposase